MIPASLNTMMMGGGALLLDIISGAAVAYSSARKLKSGITSPFLAEKWNNQFGSTATYSALYNSNNEVDISDLTSWISTTSAASIRSWYDQSGNSNHATNTSTNNGSKPTFYATNSGGYVYINGKLSPYFRALESRRLGLTSAITLASEFSIFVVERRGPTSSFGALIGSANTSPTTLNSGLGVWNDGNIYAFDQNGYLQIANSVTASRILEFTRVAGTREVYENGTLLTGSTITQTRNAIINLIGRLDSAGITRFSEAFIPEVIIYNKALTTDERNYVTNNMKSFYGIA